MKIPQTEDTIPETVTTQSKIASLNNDDLQQHVKQLQNRLQVQKMNKEKMQRLDELLQQGEQLRSSKLQVQSLLQDVERSQSSSTKLTAEMSQLLINGNNSQQRVDELFKQLQNSKSQSQTQQQQLSELIEQCHQVQQQARDSVEANNAASERLLVELKSREQQLDKTQLESSQLLQQLQADKQQTTELTKSLQDLKQAASENLNKNNSLNSRLESCLSLADASQQELTELSEDCQKIKLQTTDALSMSQAINEESLQCNREVRESLNSIADSHKELQKQLVTGEANNETVEKLLQRIHQVITESQKVNQESQVLNQQSRSSIDQNRELTRALSDRLQVALEDNKEYQEKLELAEANYTKTSKIQMKYKELFESSQLAATTTEKLLHEAAAELQANKSNQAEYSSTIRQFQQSNEQSQSIIMQSQQGMKSLMQQNQRLMEENQRLLSMVGSQNPRPVNNAENPPARKKGMPFNQSQRKAASVALSGNPEISTSAQLESLEPPKERMGFLKLMMLLALLLPFSFVASTALIAYADSQPTEIRDSGDSVITALKSSMLDRFKVKEQPENSRLLLPGEFYGNFSNLSGIGDKVPVR